jgi:hypothetical protein
MAAVVIDIATAVVTALNSPAMSQTFTATRSYVPLAAVESLTTLTVTVVPRDIAAAPLTRRADDFDYGIDIGIQKSIGSGPLTTSQIDTATDPLMRLAEEILDRFRGNTLSYGSGGKAACVAAVNAPIYLPQHLDEFRVFTSVVSLTFRTDRARV